MSRQFKGSGAHDRAVMDDRVTATQTD